MQIAFSQTFTWLIAAAGLDLPSYAAQSAISPDVIGQVYHICLDLGPAWQPYLAPWPVALEAARTTIPDGEQVAYDILIRGHLAYRADRSVDQFQPEPGVLFEQWFEAVLPYCEPLIIGPKLIDCGVLMLAVAAQFPTWAVKNSLIRFYPDSGQPYLDRLARINAMLYGLNGYELEMLQAVQDIVAHLEQHPEILRPYAPPDEPPAEPPLEPDAPPTEPVSPSVEPTIPPDQPLPFAAETPPTTSPSPTSPGRVKPDQKTFAELFRKARK